MAETTDNTSTASLLAADDARIKALLGRERAGLEAAYGEDLVYHHASGRIDDKKSLVEFLLTGPVSYRAYARESAKARCFNDIGIITGRFRGDITVNGADRVLSALYTSVWAKRDGAWKMIVWQATTVPND